MNIVLFEKETETLPLSDYRAKHITGVLKLKEGDTFKAGILNRSEGLATIEEITGTEIRFTYEPKSVPNLYPVTMIIAQVRPICMKRILREAATLGCSTIILTGTDTGEKSYAQSNIYKSGEYKDFLLDGAMQSAHAGLPEVLFAENVSQAIALAPKPATHILLDNISGSVPLSTATIAAPAVLAIGPERGWSDRERDLFIKENYSPMLLGSRVLRTETACSAGLAVLLSRMNLL